MNMLNEKIAAHISLDGLINARHLGGYPISGGGKTLEEAFIRCENPEKLSKRDRDFLYQFGIRTVIDLRSPEETSRSANPLADDDRFVYKNIPVFSTDASPDALTKTGIPMGDLYVYMLKACASSFKKIFAQIIKSSGGVLYHCTAGKDRTGVLSALLLMLAGVDEETVTAEYCYTEILLQPLVEQLKRDMPQGADPEYIDEMLSARPEFIKTAIDYINNNYTSAKGYLSSLGFDKAQINALRFRLIGSFSEEVKEK